MISPMPRNIDWWEVLDVLCWGVDKLARPTFSNLLAGYDEDRYRTLGRAFWRRLEKERWIVRSGQGAGTTFSITAKGRTLCDVINPAEVWRLRWDGLWRLVTFDIPETRRKDRKTLWRELRFRRLGLLQQSVWIWPHDIQPILHEIIQAKGIPECFAGFECARLFLCSDAEVVESAWDFEAIGRSHEAYLHCIADMIQSIHRASDLTTLARRARDEREMYAAAFAMDPLLPRGLWPKGYRGMSVHASHRDARSVLATRLRKLV